MATKPRASGKSGSGGGVTGLRLAQAIPLPTSEPVPTFRVGDPVRHVGEVKKGDKVFLDHAQIPITTLRDLQVTPKELETRPLPVFRTDPQSGHVIVEGRTTQRVPLEYIRHAVPITGSASAA
ncbi:MAG: hypothetical protein AAB455_00240 [Patescibacteria group bacterium]